MNRTLAVLLIILTAGAVATADRLLEPDETHALIKQLTGNARQHWLPQGTVRAKHLEYYAFENRVRQTMETACFDGARLCLDITLEDEQSTDIVPAAGAARQLNQDIKMNQNRIFCWDGSKQIQYYQSADYAVVSMNQTNAPELCGPLTAGIVPWGYGDFTELILMSQSPAIHERQSENGQQLVLTYINHATTPDINVAVVLDPAKANAVLSYSIENEIALLRQTYSDYQHIADKWIPAKILIEKFDKRSGTEVLLSYEDWQFEEINAARPEDSVFTVNYKNGTTVELQAAAGTRTFIYQACDGTDISPLLADKVNLLSQGPETVNCATAAIRHIARRFSKNLQPELLSNLICDQTRKTSLYDMKQTLEVIGLNCMAITTDLQTLKKIENCATVLHLNQSNHYVLLDHVEGDSVWVIDLTNRSFYTKLKAADLEAEWNRGTVLLVSDETISPPLDAIFTYLNTDQQTQILGGGFGTYSCSEVLQTEIQIPCPDPLGGFLCGGAYYARFFRKGCKEDADGGTCVGQKMLAYKFALCINDPKVQGICDNTETWISRYIRACE